MNSFTCTANLGADPETIQLGDREGRKIRLAEKAPGKKAETRWFNAIVTGRDVEIADRLRKGDKIMVTGQLVKEEYAPKKPRFKGEKVQTDTMPFAKIMEVLKSPSFFDENPSEGGEATEAEGVTTTEDPIEGGGADPLEGVY